jgi:2-polyprenyl-3-methyl-5-hydroxy-6-metoxy-1,4-benzoquinol methylase
MLPLPDSAILTNLYVPGFTKPDYFFEKRYIGLRSKEKRIYTDEEVKQLPGCDATHLHYKEWLFRKISSDKLITYLANKKKGLQILEIGCGNGWLSNRLSAIPRSRVLGVDINFTELQQAARVFNDCQKMKFMYGDIETGILADRQFDIIVLADTIQYFRSPDEILELCLQYLNRNGEIHITDTRFYAAKAMKELNDRSAEYFSSMGYPEMAYHYFHHSLGDLAQFNHTVLYNPDSFWQKFSRQTIPYHWIRIQKDNRY